MDDDESGLISFTEFAGMVREELLLGPKELPEKELKAAWLALDNDGSGRLTAGEFGAFMQRCGRGKSNEEKAALRREQLVLANQRASQEVRAVREKLLDRDIASSMSGEPPASDEEVCPPLFPKHVPALCVPSPFVTAALRVPSLQPCQPAGLRLQVRALAEMLSDTMHQLFSVVHNGVPAKVSWFRLCAAAATARCAAADPAMPMRLICFVWLRTGSSTWMTMRLV